MDEQRQKRAIQELVAGQLLDEISATELVFRHALTREASYSSLLRRERQRLHRAIAQALEEVYAGSLDAHLAELAYHYTEAGAWTQALDYARRAGEQAQARYAQREAVQQFTRALEATEKLALPPLAQLHRLRALAHGTAGNFAEARADFEAALQIAETTQDHGEECAALLGLGQLWASRDYDRTAGYYRRALELARTLDDPIVLGQSLNRVGNWYVNINRPSEGIRYHQEALSIFEKLGDRHGMAETLDLLGLTSQIRCDPVRTADYYGRAVTLFRETGDKPGLSSSVAVMSIMNGTFHSFYVGTIDGLPEGVEPQMAVDIAVEIGWRAGESYARNILGLYLGSRGDYAAGLESSAWGLRIAEEIGHRQWTAIGHFSIGSIYLDLLDPQSARAHFEQALQIAREAGSLLLTLTATGTLGTALIELNEYGTAEAVIDAALGRNGPAETQGQRLCWCARAELALARDDPATALQIVDRMIRLAPQAGATERTTPRIWLLRAEALVRLGSTEEAERILETLQDVTEKRRWPSLLWRVHLSLGRLYEATHRHEEARGAFLAARKLVEELGHHVPDETLRRLFVERALAR